MSSNPLTLITGASGFIGGQIALLLGKQKRPLRLLLRKGATTRHLKDLEYETAEGDLRDPVSLKKAFKDVEVVYHVAALYALWTRDKRDFRDINITGTENMCRAALDAGVKRFVYTSSTAAVGISEKPDTPLDENAPWNREWTSDPYSHSKYQAEQVVKSYVKRGLPAVILNPTGPVGPGDVRPTPAGKMICDFAKGKLPFYVDAHLSMVDVRDVAKGHVLAEEKGKIGERYILCAENISAKELFEKLARVCGKKAPKLKLPIPLVQVFACAAEWMSDHILHKPPLITKPYADLLPYYFWFQNEKSKRELGLEYHPVEEALRDAVEWFKEEKYL